MKIMRTAVVVGAMGAVAMMGAPASASATTSADSALVATCSKGSYKLRVTVTYVNGLGAHRFRKVFWTASGGLTNVKVSLVQDRGGLPDVAFKSFVITGNNGHKDIPVTRPMADRVFVKLVGKTGVTSCSGQSGVI